MSNGTEDQLTLDQPSPQQPAPPPTPALDTDFLDALAGVEPTDDAGDAQAAADASDTQVAADETSGSDDKNKPDGEDTPDAELARLVNYYGCSQEEVAEFGDETAQRTVLAAMDRREAALALQFARDTETRPGAPAAEPAAEPEVEPDPWKSGLDPDDVAPELIAAIEEIGTSQAKQIRDLTARVEQAEGQQAGQAQAAAQQQFDSAVAALPEGYEEKIGKGPLQSLNHRTAEFLNREDLYEQMVALNGMQERRGRPALAYDELVARSASALWPEVGTKMTQKKISDQTRPGSFTPRPTRRTRTEAEGGKTPTQRAVEKSREQLRQKGIDPDD